VTPPPHRPASVYHPAFGAGGYTLARGRGGGGSIFYRAPDTALYSTYISTLWMYTSVNKKTLKRIKKGEGESWRTIRRAMI
jgi:hypothetical protein